MFITIKLATLVRAIAVIVAGFVVMFVALVNAPSTSNVPPPDPPASTQKAHI